MPLPPVAASLRVYDQTSHGDVEPDADGTYCLRCWHSYRLHCSEDPRLSSSAGSCFRPSDGSEWIAEANFGAFIGTLPILGHVDHRFRSLRYSEPGGRPESAAAASPFQETPGERRRRP